MACEINRLVPCALPNRCVVYCQQKSDVQGNVQCLPFLQVTMKCPLYTQRGGLGPYLQSVTSPSTLTQFYSILPPDLSCLELWKSQQAVSTRPSPLKIWAMQGQNSLKLNNTDWGRHSGGTVAWPSSQSCSYSRGGDSGN